MIDAVTQFTNLYYNIVNLLTSESGRQFLENPAGYTSQKRIVVCFIKAIPEAQGLFSYYSPSRNPDTPIGNFLFCFQNLFQYIVIGNFFFVRLFVYVREGAIMNPVFWLIIQLPSENGVPAHNAVGYVI